MAFAKRRYDRCKHRTTTFALETYGETDKQGFLATSHCPNETADGLHGDRHWLTKPDAAAELKNTVAPIACGSCVLFKLTEVQIMTRRAEIARAKAALTNAESDRLEAARRFEELTAAGQKDVDRINQRLLGGEPAAFEPPTELDTARPLPPVELPPAEPPQS